ncbi:MAG: lipopolysaccharide biosynthesis protein [Bacillota bacterium]
MSTTRIIARNVIWNWGALAANLLAGFIVAPFLVHHLGETGYGLWILIASLIEYFGLLDIGIRGAMGRQIAFYHAKHDRQGLNETLNTALAILCAGGGVALLGTLGVILVFFRIFEVPPDQVANVRTALLLIGVTLVLWLPLSLFDAVLWAYQRFDLINAVGIVSAVVRVATTFYFIGRGYGLVALSIINLLTLAFPQALKGVLAFWHDRQLRLGTRYLSRNALRALFGIGFWNCLLTLATICNRQVGSVIIGARLAVDLVTPFSVAIRLIGYGREFLVAGTGVLTPLVIKYHAGEQLRQQKQLYLEGSKYCLIQAIFFTAVFIVLGRQIIVLWMGEALEPAYPLLLILTLGEALPMSQWVGFSVIIGKYHHKMLGWLGIIENVLAIALAWVLVRPYGMIGVCLAFAIPGMVCRGLFQMIYACRLVGVSIQAYLAQVLLPVLAAATLPVIGLIAAVHWHAPRNWPELLLYIALYGIAHLLVMVPLVGSWWLRRRKLPAGIIASWRSLAHRLVVALQANR